MNWRISRILGALIIMAGLAASCAKDPFSTRRPNRPTGEQGTYKTPVDPQIALDTNLYYAMIERNAGHYSQTLADTFIYTFDFVLIGPPDSALRWDRIEEDRIARNLFAGVTALDLTWAPTAGRSDRLEDSIATLYRSYVIDASMSSPGDSTVSVFKGDLTVLLSRNSQGLWWIVRWDDLHLEDGSPSWADLKSRFR